MTIRAYRHTFICALALCLGVAAGVLCSSFDERALIHLARSAVRAEVEGKEPPHPTRKSRVRPVFVTIERKNRVLGCRGSLDIRSRCLEEEIITSARSAARHDPRHKPLTPKDLNDFQVTVTIVDRIEPLDRIESLRPDEGLALKSGNRVGIVLPWEGKDPRTRLQWAYRKAGVSPRSSCTLLRLKAERFRG